MPVTINTCSTEWGWVGIAVSAVGLLGCTLPRPSPEDALSPLLHRWPGAGHGSTPRLTVLQHKLQRYFLGEPVDFRREVLNSSQATKFELRVWKCVRAIPRGEVRSYGWIARQVGSLRAARAVGRVMATNPVPIIVPCHRVVGHHGQLTGFGGGLVMKRRLLDMEGCSRAIHLDVGGTRC
jgi:methylated-DNA-[protein]-cysteine S-methyltransferase